MFRPTYFAFCVISTFASATSWRTRLLISLARSPNRSPSGRFSKGRFSFIRCITHLLYYTAGFGFGGGAGCCAPEMFALNDCCCAPGFVELRVPRFVEPCAPVFIELPAASMDDLMMRAP